MTVLLLTGACSGGSESTGSEPAADAAGELEGAVRAGSGGSAPGAVPKVAAARPVVTVRAIIRTGEIAVVEEDLEGVRREVDDLLDALGGTLDHERTEHDAEGDVARSTLRLRVPVDRFADAMAALKGFGEVRHSETSAKNVTAEVIDVDERVETLETSLDRLQDYQRGAQDVEDLIDFEDQITERESQLQSLQAQQAYLVDQTAMSTISVHLSTPREYVAPPGALDDAGFLQGLKNGWSALTGTVVVALTVIGAVLPFAVTMTLVGVPLWLLVRRLRRPRTPTGDLPTGA